MDPSLSRPSAVAHAVALVVVSSYIEREAKDSLRKYSGVKSYLEEKLDEKRRLDNVERQKGVCVCCCCPYVDREDDSRTASSLVQEAMTAITRNNFSSPEFDPAYVRAKELEQLEREAEEKSKASLLQFSQHDVSHEMSMRNGIMMRKTSIDSDTSSVNSASSAGASGLMSFSQCRLLFTDATLAIHSDPSNELPVHGQVPEESAEPGSDQGGRALPAAARGLESEGRAAAGAQGVDGHGAQTVVRHDAQDVV